MSGPFQPSGASKSGARVLSALKTGPWLYQKGVEKLMEPGDSGPRCKAEGRQFSLSTSFSSGNSIRLVVCVPQGSKRSAGQTLEQSNILKNSRGWPYMFWTLL